MRISENIEAKWGGGSAGGGRTAETRKLEIWDRITGQRIECNTREARMLAALIHVEVSESKKR